MLTQERGVAKREEGRSAMLQSTARPRHSKSVCDDAQLLEDALMLADDLEDGNTGYLIECALDEARSQQFRL